MPRDDEWPDERVARLRGLWAEVPQLSTAEIGRRLGITKNAVVAKAHRINLPGRPSPIRPAGEGAAPPPPRRQRGATLAPLPSVTTSAAAPQVVVPPEAPPPPPRRHPATPGRSCCWPIGEPGSPTFRFCDGAQEPGRPYCAEHCALAYVKPEAMRKSAS